MSDIIRDQLQTALGDAYQLDRELGGGGMSLVFVATEKALGRQVVVKVLPAEMAGQVSVERFKREIALAARLQHPHIVPLLTAGDAAGLPYFTMPLVEGESLRARLVRHGELPLNEGVRLLREIAAALAYAHERGVVHRDIKPDNVLLSAGSAMITDFGVAKALSASSNGDAGSMTSLGIALGTPAYMSPEQASADPAVDHRADIYAFGVLAYELLTGQPPFVGRTPQNLLAAHVTEAPEPVTKRRASIPPALAALIMRCLEKRAADRPQSAMELVHALDQITTPSGGTQPTTAQAAYGSPGSGAGVLTPAPAASPSTGAGRTRALAVAVGIALVAALGWFWTTRASAGPVSRSVAVLPMEIGADTAHAYLADGLSNELTTALTKVPGLAVRAYSSSRAMRGQSAREAGKALDVSSVLTATLIRSGDRLRVTASLVNAADDVVLWSDKFEATDGDQFALQDKLVAAIAGALKVSLSPATQQALAVRGTQSAEAHDLVQRARYASDEFTRTSLLSAVALAEAAIAKDSSYADAWSALAEAWGTLADDFISPLEAMPHVTPALKRALELEPNSAEAHAETGINQLFYDWDVAAAKRSFERALALDSANLTAGTNYPGILSSVMHLEDSARAVRARTARLNPLSRAALISLLRDRNGWDRRSRDSSRTLCATAKRIGEDVGEACEQQRLIHEGKRSEVVERVRKIVATKPEGQAQLSAVGALLAAGDTAGARAQLARVTAIYPRTYVREDVIATYFYAMGDVSSSVAWWERAVGSRGSQVVWLASSDRFAELRKDPRVQALLKKAGLPK